MLWEWFILNFKPAGEFMSNPWARTDKRQKYYVSLEVLSLLLSTHSLHLIDQDCYSVYLIVSLWIWNLVNY